MRCRFAKPVWWIATDLVPGFVYGGRRELDSRPRNRKPGLPAAQGCEALAARFGQRGAADQEEGDVRADGRRDRCEIRLDVVHLCEASEGGRGIGAGAAQSRAWRDSLG